MTHEEMQLVDDPKVSVQLLRERSMETPVLVFKNSPICPVSTMAEGNLRSWLAARGAAPLVVCVVDVISERVSDTSHRRRSCSREGSSAGTTATAA